MPLSERGNPEEKREGGGHGGVPTLCHMAYFHISIVTKSLTPCGVAPPCFPISGHLAGLPQAQELIKAMD